MDEPRTLGLKRPAHRAAWRAGLLWGGGFLLVSGLISVLIPNTWFSRVTEIHWWDYYYLPVSAILVGVFVAQRALLRLRSPGCKLTAGAGGIAAFLGFSCPVCNKVLVLLLGLPGVLTWIEPYQAWIGAGGILALAGPNAWLYRVRQLVARTSAVLTMPPAA